MTSTLHPSKLLWLEFKYVSQFGRVFMFVQFILISIFFFFFSFSEKMNLKQGRAFCSHHKEHAVALQIYRILTWDFKHAKAAETV